MSSCFIVATSSISSASCNAYDKSSFGGRLNYENRGLYISLDVTFMVSDFRWSRIPASGRILRVDLFINAILWYSVAPSK